MLRPDALQRQLAAKREQIDLSLRKTGRGGADHRRALDVRDELAAVLVASGLATVLVLLLLEPPQALRPTVRAAIASTSLNVRGTWSHLLAVRA